MEGLNVLSKFVWNYVYIEQLCLELKAFSYSIHMKSFSYLYFQHHTTGINCEQCEDGYFRPANASRNDTRPCKKCKCNGPGMTGLCVKEDSHLLEGLV